MASNNLHQHPSFLVFPTLCRVYTWRVASVETNRTVSRHKELALAIERAEKLNRRRFEAFEGVVR